MSKRVSPMVDARRRRLADVAVWTERAPRVTETMLVSEMKEAAKRAAKWAYAQRRLTGRQHYIEEMPPSYTDQDYVRDCLRRLDREGADDHDAVAVACDCLKVGAGGCLTPWERWYIVSLLDFDGLNETQNICLGRCLAKIREWVSMSASIRA
jgi:hypothetical protein